MSKKSNTLKLVVSAAAIALATVISVAIKLPSLPNGGSTTLFSMLVMCLIGYWYGPVTGIISGLAYGILQFITGPYVVHPAQVILDYPLAFGALGLSGLFHNKKHGLVLGYLTGVFGRFVFHQISGFIFYTTYVDSLQGNIAALWASTVYNLSYILPEVILTLVLLAIPPVRNMLKRVKNLVL